MIKRAVAIAITSVKKYLQDNLDSFDTIIWVLLDKFTYDVYNDEINRICNRERMTEKGVEVGIKEIEKISEKGNAYTVLTYPPKIQRILVEKYIGEV